MLEPKTIGFIGAGNMGQALIGGLIDTQSCPPTRIICSDPRTSQLEQLHTRFGVRTCTENSEVIQTADLVVVAVKPQVIRRVITEISPHLKSSQLVLSIAAGVPLSLLESLMPQGIRVVRAMPNVCVTVKEGITALVRGSCAGEEDLRLAETVFNAVGRTITLSQESLMDAVTGLSASGPAYLFLIMEAMADGGVQMGLPRPEALQLAAQTVLGAARLLLDSSLHPGQLKDMVTSPGGTTIAGLHALEKGAVRYAVMEAIGAATRRSIELGQLAQTKTTS